MVKKYTLILLAALLISSCNANPAHTETDHTDVLHQNENNELPATNLMSPTTTSVENMTLTEDTINRALPEDVIQEIGFFGGLGGRDSCFMKDAQTPVFLDKEVSKDYSYEWMQVIDIAVCGIQMPDNVQASIEFPDGSISQTTLSAEQTEGLSSGEIIFLYQPLVYSPLGKYTVHFKGNSWELDFHFSVVEPTTPTLYSYESRLFFVNFAPDEVVRLFVYDYKANYNGLKLLGWNNYQVNQSGDLTIDTDFTTAGYIALGEISNHQASVGIESGDIYCQGSLPPSKIVPWGYAEVLVDNLPTYGFDANQNEWFRGNDQKIGRGTVVLIASNAKCIDHAFLWELRCPDDSCTWGMIPESGSDGYYLRPIEAPPSTATPNPTNIPVCPHTLPTRIQVGMNAEVTTSGMAPQLSLRAQPSMNAEKVHVIAAGRDMVVLQGPTCADDSYWWYIRSEQGFEGWAREGDNEDYWIDPLP